jgi:hypothetical protein
MKKLFTLLVLCLSIVSIMEAQIVMDYSIYNKHDGTTFGPAYKYYYGYNAQGYQISRATWKWNATLGDYAINTSGGLAEYEVDANGNMTRVIGYNYDATTQVYTPYFSQTYSYDANNNKTSEYYFNAYDAATGTFIATVAYAQGKKWTYDNNGNVLEYEILEGGDPSGVHVPGWKNTYIYDSNNAQIQDIYSMWDAGTSAWLPKTKKDDVFVYDGNNNPTSQVHSEYDYVADAWVEKTDMWKEYTNTYTYDVNNRITEKLIELTDLALGKRTLGKYVYEYDGNGNMTLATYYQYASFTLANKITYTYDANGNLIMEEPLKFFADEWLGNGYKYEYAYDDNGNQTFYRRWEWDSTAKAWKGSIYSSYSWTQEFNAEGFVINKYTYKWNATTSAYIEDQEFLYHYADLATAVEDVDNMNVSVYPNPTQGLFTVSNVDAGTSVAVYSLTGAKVFETGSTNSVMNIDITSQPNGVYIMVVGDKSYKIVKH